MTLVEILKHIIKESAKTDATKQKFAKKIDEDTFNKLVELDPSVNKQYVEWLCSRFVAEQLSVQAIKADYFRNHPESDARNYSEQEITDLVKVEIKKRMPAIKLFWEDAYKLTEYLELFLRLNKKFKQRDINSYKTFKSFADAVIELKHSLSDEELEFGMTKYEKYKEFIIGKVSGYTVFEIPRGRKDLYGMSCELGSGTEWCTATGKTRTHFDNYISHGSLFIFINSRDKYQFNYETNSFMDKHDKQIF